MIVNLVPVTRDNWQACCALSLPAEQQDFVASNLYSIAEAQFYPTMQVRALINQSSTLVGLAVYGISPNTGQYRVARLMIDQAFQGQGYGRAAMQAILAEVAALGDVDQVWLSYREHNHAARNLYQSLGFQEQSCDPAGRIVAMYSLVAQD
ncbi:spermine/spermidine acetyltransferase [Herpetosiphon gulosus]|uniref:Spermine/spermidine acetyltransferase n=2 Tax=Herpetosiphon gulosus TaxID=1973496 RepID=A0ABP9X491_9CHLR